MLAEGGQIRKRSVSDVERPPYVDVETSMMADCIRWEGDRI